MPLLPGLRNIFQVRVLREGKGRSLCSPAGYTGKAVGTIAYDRQIIRNRTRGNAKSFHNPSLITYRIAPAIYLNYACPYDALGEVFVRGTNEDLVYLFIRCGFGGRR